MSCYCKDVVSVAQGDQTARLEMASGLSQCSKLSSLLQMTVVEVACLCVPWCNWVTAWTRYCSLLSLAVDVRRGAQFDVGLPWCSVRPILTILRFVNVSLSDSLCQVCACLRLGAVLSVAEVCFIHLFVPSRSDSCVDTLPIAPRLSLNNRQTNVSSTPFHRDASHIGHVCWSFAHMVIMC